MYVGSAAYYRIEGADYRKKLADQQRGLFMFVVKLFCHVQVFFFEVPGVFFLIQALSIIFSDQIPREIAEEAGKDNAAKQQKERSFQRFCTGKNSRCEEECFSPRNYQSEQQTRFSEDQDYNDHKPSPFDNICRFDQKNSLHEIVTDMGGEGLSLGCL